MMRHCRPTPLSAMAAVAAFLSPAILSAQITFQRTYGGPGPEEAWSVQQTADGGYILTGQAAPSDTEHADVCLVKVDAIGRLAWSRTFGGNKDDVANSVRQTTDCGYVVAGYTESLGRGGYDVYLIRTDANGDTLWTRTHGGAERDAGNGVQVTPDGGCIVAAETWSRGAGLFDAWLIKTDASGDTEWTRTFGGVMDDVGRSVELTRDGGYVMAGWTSSTGAGSSDAYVVRTDSIGNELWTRTYGGFDYDVGNAVRQTKDGGFVVAGLTMSSGAGEADAFLVKTDSSGGQVWYKTFGGWYGEAANSVQQTGDGGYVIMGWTWTFDAGPPNAYLVRTDADGDELWSKVYGGKYADKGNSGQQTADGGYVIAGSTDSYGAGDLDFYLLKTDSLGKVAMAEPKTLDAPRMTLDARPNPCRGATTIRLSPFAPRRSPLTLRVYDAQGRCVRSFSSLLSPPSSLVWDGRDDRDQSLAAGTYFIRLDNGSRHATTRVVLQR